MHSLWNEVQDEPAGAALIAANVVGFVLVVWLLIILLRLKADVWML